MYPFQKWLRYANFCIFYVCHKDITIYSLSWSPCNVSRNLRFEIFNISRYKIYNIFTQNKSRYFRHNISSQHIRYDASGWTTLRSECVWGSSVQWYNQANLILCSINLAKRQILSNKYDVLKHVTNASSKMTFILGWGIKGGNGGKGQTSFRTALTVFPSIYLKLTLRHLSQTAFF